MLKKFVAASGTVQPVMTITSWVEGGKLARTNREPLSRANKLEYLDS